MLNRFFLSEIKSFHVFTTCLNHAPKIKPNIWLLSWVHKVIDVYINFFFKYIYYIYKKNFDDINTFVGLESEIANFLPYT